MNVTLTVVGTMAEVLAVLNASQNAGVKATVAPAAKGPAPKAQAETAEDTEETEDSPKASAAPAKGPAPKAGAAKGPAKGPAPKAGAAKGPAKGPAPKAAAEEIDFDAMDEEEQLAEIVRLSTTFTKKGRSADIRTLVGIFDAARASELDPAVYGEYYSLLNRMKAGETAEDLAAENVV